MSTTADKEALARFTSEHKRGQTVIPVTILLSALEDAVDTTDVIQGLRQRDELPGCDDVTLPDVLAGLRLLPKERQRVDWLELNLIHAALDRGATLASLAAEHGVTPQAFGKRYRTLGGTRELKAGRPKNTSHTITKHWVALTVDGLDHPDRDEIILTRELNDANGKRPEAFVKGGHLYTGPGSDLLEWGSMSYLGELPEPGETVQGVVRVWSGNPTSNREVAKLKDLDVYVRAENVPLEPK